MTLKEIIKNQDLLINQQRAILKLYKTDNNFKRKLLPHIIEIVKKFTVCAVCGIMITKHVVEKTANKRYIYRDASTNKTCFVADIDISDY